jgi:hypothetical protein
MLKASWLPLFLLSLSACSVADRAPIPAPVVIRTPVPAEYLKTPPGRYTGPLDTTGDLVTRGNVAEASLRACVVQLDAIRAWNNETQTLATPAPVR